MNLGIRTNLVIRIAHLTTAHARRDIRIELKECRSLAAAGYEVHEVVADGRGPEAIGGVQIHDIGAARNRLGRILLHPWRMWATARRLDARVYHIHDPELLLVAPLLRLQGAKVVYDAHEDLPRNLLAREWVPRPIRRTLAAVVEVIEDLLVGGVSAVVGATPTIATRFSRKNSSVVAVRNYPLSSEIDEPVRPIGDARAVCYVGGISRARGILEMVRALELVDAKLILAGAFDGPATEAAARSLPGWARVDYRGVVDRSGVRDVLSQSRAGLVFLHPVPNHVNSLPIKIFEYMAAGLPVLASDFPLWRGLVADAGAGTCHDPMDPSAIARAIGRILDDPDEASAMGKRGREAVLSLYRWDFEAARLLELYARLTS